MNLLCCSVYYLKSILDIDVKIFVSAIFGVHNFCLIHVNTILVIQNVPSQQVLLTEHKLMVKKEESPLLAFALF